MSLLHRLFGIQPPSDLVIPVVDDGLDDIAAATERSIAEEKRALVHKAQQAQSKSRLMRTHAGMMRMLEVENEPGS